MDVTCLLVFESGEIIRAILMAALLAILFTPVGTHLMNGWASKRHEMLSYFSEQSAQEYFARFSPTEEIPEGKACTRLKDMYDRSIGRRMFIIPIIVLALISVPAAWAATGTGLQLIEALQNPGFSLPGTALAAIAGAYIWVASDFIARLKRRNLGPNDLLIAALRFAIAIPMGYAFAFVVAKDLGPFIAFAIGAFPLGPLTVMLRRIVGKHLGIEDKGEEASDQIIRLQGINKDIAERFEDNDIFTISQLAETDPVSITRLTNLDFNFVLDCISQAIAWTYLGDRLNKIRPLGLRGAFEIHNFILALDGTGDWDNIEADTKRVEAALPQISEAAGYTAQSIQIPFREIAEDPRTIFMHRVFR